MSDFYQNGIITTLHDLAGRKIDDLEYELHCFSKIRPMSLLLPSLYSELQTEALPNIVNELKKVSYLKEIVIGLDRANKEEFRHAVKFFGELPQHHRILWNDGPRLLAIDKMLKEKGLAPQQMGKGRNVWYCLGYIYASGKSESIALHDCDITTYDRRLLARLIYPVANPNFNYEF
ncbi:MAG: glucosyl-3-phosphoglycerate synthase, partial [Kiritimatiellia bacterium]